jgi:hypothetical protein
MLKKLILVTAALSCINSAFADTNMITIVNNSDANITMATENMLFSDLVINPKTTGYITSNMLNNSCHAYGCGVDILAIKNGVTTDIGGLTFYPSRPANEQIGDPIVYQSSSYEVLMSMPTIYVLNQKNK